MQARLLWEEAPPQKIPSPSKAACHDVAFSPDGALVLCGIGERVYVFDRDCGTVLHSLKGHKGVVYCVAWAADGSLFASGGADHTVIVWSSSFEGRVKYTHPESVQCLAFNPATHQLASGAASELGLWHTEQRSVAKHAIKSKILAMSWTPDGCYLALGHLDGQISLRNADAQEQRTLETSMPVWSLLWSPMEEGDATELVVCRGDGHLVRYSLKGEKTWEQRLSFCPCFVSPYPSTGIFMIGGTDGTIRLLNNAGQEIQTLLEKEMWLWSAKALATSKGVFVAVGSCDGSLAMYSVVTEHQTCLAGDWLAQRHGVDIVSVRHLPTNETSSNAFPAPIDAIALYTVPLSRWDPSLNPQEQNQLAVQVGGEVVLHALNRQGRVEVIGRVAVANPWRCVATTALHVICVAEAELQALDFSGVVARSWKLDSEISFVSVVGGPTQHETLQVGCRNGAVFFLRLHNAIPQLIVEHSTEIVCLDVDTEWSSIAVVDGEGRLSIYDLSTQRKLWEVEDMGVSNVSWNRHFSELLAYTSDGHVSIKAGSHAAVQTTLTGRLVGFRGAAIYTSNGEAVSTEHVHLAPYIARYLEDQQFSTAYRLACLGVDDEEWKQLGVDCLFSKELEIAKKCFAKIADVLFSSLTERLEEMKSADRSEDYFAELYCSLGRFEDAANCYARAGDMKSAMNIFTTMRLYDEGKRWADSYRDQRHSAAAIESAVAELVHHQARWVEASEDVRKAYELYVSVGDDDKALDMIERHQLTDAISEIARKFEEKDTDLLKRCLKLSESFGDVETMEYVLERLHDDDGLLKLYCSTAQWEKAERFATDAESLRNVCSARAAWLIEKGELLTAVELYAQHDFCQKARELLLNVTQSKIATQRFIEAAHLYAKLAFLAEDASSYVKWMEASELYYAYSIVHESLESPFAVTDVGTLFNVSQWLTARLLKRESLLPNGVRLSRVLYALYKSAKAIEAHNVAQSACLRLAQLQLPLDWQEEIQVEALHTAHSHPKDHTELCAPCIRCREPIEMTHLEVGTLLNHRPRDGRVLQEDACPHCDAPFLRCFVTFEKLPVVEFLLAEGVSVDAAIAAIESEDAATAERQRRHSESASSAQVLRLSGSSASDLSSSEDPFDATEAHLTVKPTLELPQLRHLSRRDVLIFQSPDGRRRETRFYKILDRSVALCMGGCGHLYIKEEYQQRCLEQRPPPFESL